MNESVDDAPSLTFLENGNNYAADSEESILYIRICFEGVDKILKYLFWSTNHSKRITFFLQKSVTFLKTVSPFQATAVYHPFPNRHEPIFQTAYGHISFKSSYLHESFPV